MLRRCTGPSKPPPLHASLTGEVPCLTPLLQIPVGLVVLSVIVSALGAVFPDPPQDLRHPSVEASRGSSVFIPNDVNMENDSRLAIVTGTIAASNWKHLPYLHFIAIHQSVEVLLDNHTTRECQMNLTVTAAAASQVLMASKVHIR